MTPLSTLTNEALHALVVRSLEGVTEGPWYRMSHQVVKPDPHCPRDFDEIVRTDAEPVDWQLSILDFIAQSRDLVPELDRRLRETEAKLEVAIKVLSSNGFDFAVKRIAAITQP